MEEQFRSRCSQKCARPLEWRAANFLRSTVRATKSTSRAPRSSARAAYRPSPRLGALDSRRFPMFPPARAVHSGFFPGFDRRENWIWAWLHCFRQQSHWIGAEGKQERDAIERYWRSTASVERQPSRMLRAIGSASAGRGPDGLRSGPGACPSPGCGCSSSCGRPCTRRTRRPPRARR